MPYHPTPLHAIAATVVMTTGQRDILHAAGNELAALRAERDALRAERDRLREALRNLLPDQWSGLSDPGQPHNRTLLCSIDAIKAGYAALGEAMDDEG